MRRLSWLLFPVAAVIALRLLQAVEGRLYDWLVGLIIHWFAGSEFLQRLLLSAVSTPYVLPGIIVAVPVASVLVRRLVSLWNVQKPQPVAAPRGFLDFQEDALRAMQQIGRIYGRMAPEQNRVGRQFQLHTSRMRKHQTRGTLTPRRARQIAADAARDMDRFSAFLERQLGPLRQETNLLGESLVGWMNWVTPITPDDANMLRQFRDPTVTSLLNTSRTMRAAITEYRAVLVGLRGSGGVGISQDMNRASERLLPLIDEMLQVSGSLEESLAEVLTIIDRKLARNADGSASGTAGSSPS